MRASRLTPAQNARVPEFVQHWIGIGLSAAAIDHAEAEPALARLYAAAGLAAPRIVWTGCPLTAMLSASAYTAIRRVGREAAAGDRRALGQIAVATIPTAAHRRIELGVEAAVATALGFGDAVGDGFAAAQAIQDAHQALLDRVLEASLEPGLQGRLQMLMIEPIRRGIRPLYALVERALDRVGPATLGEPARVAYFGAPLWIGQAAVMDYLNRVLGIELDRRFIDAAANGGMFWPLDGLCFAAERPTHLNWDEAGQLHCEVGPSVAFSSGLSWWHWHGVRVPQNAIEAPQTITIEAIHAAAGPERRRVMIERYRCGTAVSGIAAYLRDAGAHLLDRDPGFGRLWRLDTGEAAPRLMVEVENRSPEPDGSYRHFLLRVDPELRPILGSGGFGPPPALDRPQRRRLHIRHERRRIQARG